MKRSAFTMIELVFVIVILGILAAVAVPRLAASKVDAQIAKAKSDIAAIRSSIATKRAQNLMSGISSFPDLNGATGLFGGVLDYPIESGVSGWTSANATRYAITIDNIAVNFEYSTTNGTFTCYGKGFGGAELNSGAAIGMCTTLTQ